MPDQTYQLPRDSTMQGIVTQLQNIASRMSSNGSGGGSSYDDTALVALVNSKSTVVANPQGTPDGELTAIEIDGDIYEIVGSGGSGSSSGGQSSGSGYEATLIYDGSALSSLQSSIELDEEWDNYDAIVFVVNFGSNQSKTSFTIYKDMLTANIGKIVGIAGFASVYAGATVNSDKKTFSNIYSGGDIQNIYGVYGLKFGSGGSSSGEPHLRTELFKSATPQSGVISLSDAIDNYDDIEIVMGWVAASDTASHVERFDAEYFVTSFPYAANPTNANPHALLEMWASNGFSCAVGDDTNTALQTWGHNGSSGIIAVYGIKYGSDGSSSQEEYSTTEKVIGTWVDGKPIYRKVYYSANGFAQWQSVAVDVSDLNIELLIRSDTVNYAASNNSVSNLSTLSGITNRQMWIELGTGSLYLVMDDVKYIILEYTKTTD